jgi:hypothetical protein
LALVSLCCLRISDEPSGGQKVYWLTSRKVKSPR